MVTNSNLTRFGVTSKWNYTIRSRNYALDFFRQDQTRRYLLRILRMYEYDSSIVYSHFALNQHNNSFLRLFVYDGLMYTRFFYHFRPHKYRKLRTFSLESFHRYKARSHLFRIVKLISQLSLIRRRKNFGYSAVFLPGNFFWRNKKLKSVTDLSLLNKVYVNRFLKNFVFKFRNLRKFGSDYKTNFKRLKKSLSLFKLIRTIRWHKLHSMSRFRPFYDKKRPKKISVIPTLSLIKEEVDNFYDSNINLFKESFKSQFKNFQTKKIRVTVKTAMIFLNKLQSIDNRILVNKNNLVLQVVNFFSIIDFIFFRFKLLKNNRNLSFFKRFIYFKLLNIIFHHFKAYSSISSFNLNDTNKISIFVKKNVNKLFKLLRLRISNMRLLNKLKLNKLQIRKNVIINKNVIPEVFTHQASYSIKPNYAHFREPIAVVNPIKNRINRRKKNNEKK